MKAYDERYEAALTLAASAHHTQVRKVDNVPYVTHLVHVSVILLRHGFSPELAAAGLLHDVVEDQGISLDRIEQEFGPMVSEIVDALTEHKTENGEVLPWQTRKTEALERLGNAGDEAVAVKAADALHNARSVLAGLRSEGPSIWDRFHRGADLSLWYYRRVADLVYARLGTHPLALELLEAVEDLAGEIARDEAA